MNDSAKIIISMAFMIWICGCFSLYLNHKENIAKIEAERELRQIISNLKEKENQWWLKIS